MSPKETTPSAGAHAPEQESRVLVLGAETPVGATLAEALTQKPFKVQASPGDAVLADAAIKGFGAVVLCPDGGAASAAAMAMQMDRCLAAGCYVLLLSSHLAFDGTKPFPTHRDVPNPTTPEGRAFLSLETHLLRAASERGASGRGASGRGAIMRLTDLTCPLGEPMRQWRELARDGAPIKAATDRLISPISIESLVECVVMLIERREAGVFHLGGEEEISHIDYARRLFGGDAAGLALITPVVVGAARTHPSLATYVPTREQQYQILYDTRRVTMGMMAGHTYLHDPKRLTFTLSRYKFVAKMLAGFENVLEVGCADAFASAIVMKEVGSLTACDFDPGFIDDVRRTHAFADKIGFQVHNMVDQPMPGQFDGVYSLDVLEHISKPDEARFLNNICASLRPNGVCVIGMPSIESQLYASKESKEGHVNCQSGAELKATMLRHFERVFMFSMNDEVVHTGFFPMAQYLLALCCSPRTP